MRRSLAVLGMVVLVIGGASIWVAIRGAGHAPVAPAPVLALPGLADRLESLRQVRLSSGDGAAVTLQRGDQGWIVAQRSYPADPARLRALLICLSGLRVIEEKTADPARFAQLEVDDPASPQARGERLELRAADASWTVLLGKAAGSDGNYVRVLSRPDRPQGLPNVLLVRPRINADPRPEHWIVASLLEVPGERIAQIDVQVPGEQPYRLSRSKPESADLTLAPLPPDRQASASNVAAVAGVLAHLSAEDVRGQTAGTPTRRLSRATFKTLDGLQIDLEGLREAGADWVRIHVDDENHSSQASALESRVHGFEFRIAATQYDEIFRPLDDLLVPREPARR